MIIAVNTRLLSKDIEEGNFIYECFSRITRQQTQHTFIFIFDRPYSPAFIFSKNIIPVITSPKADNILLSWVWKNIKVPLILKKYKANLFISHEQVCTSLTNVGQYLVMHERAIVPYSLKRINSLFHRKIFASCLKHAKVIYTWSESSKKDLEKKYKINQGKIQIIYTGINEIFEPIGPDEREIVKHQYAEDCEYFLSTAIINTTNDLIDLLKAFSIFKKHQKSNMKLLIANVLKKNSGFEETLRSFKYKENVKLLEDLSTIKLAKITAAAYAVIYLTSISALHTPLIEALKCNVPVITNKSYDIQEICGDAALYASYGDSKNIADNLMLIFKDEKLRRELISRGTKQVVKYSWENTSSLLWQSLLKSTT